MGAITTGSGSNLEHYIKLKNMKDSGTLPESFNETFDSLSKDYEHVTFQPEPPIRFIWNIFWNIRRTKPYEHPITYTDVYHCGQVTNVTFDLYESNLLFKWDREYYYYYNEHRN